LCEIQDFRSKPAESATISARLATGLARSQRGPTAAIPAAPGRLRPRWRRPTSSFLRACRAFREPSARSGMNWVGAPSEPRACAPPNFSPGKKARPPNQNRPGKFYMSVTFPHCRCRGGGSPYTYPVKIATPVMAIAAPAVWRMRRPKVWLIRPKARPRPIPIA
jgi:hypothetical protein